MAITERQEIHQVEDHAWYGVRTLSESQTGTPPYLQEESIRIFLCESEEKALALAAKAAAVEVFKNVFGQDVRWVLVEVGPAYELLETPASGCEVYSRFIGEEPMEEVPEALRSEQQST